ncbi:MAG: 50S ribosomal protein L3 [Candidatus Spechtbacterales bacterium]
MSFIVGKKIGMTQVFDESGKVQPVTLIDVDNTRVTKVITKDKNGYNAVQVGIGKKKLNKPMQGALKDFVDEKGRGFAFLREFRVEDVEGFKAGDIITLDDFSIGDKVVVSGITKGKGFQGVVKRWGFKGGPKSHGQKHTLRTPGSIGSAFPQRVLKGLKMAGRMGGDRKSVINLKVAYIDKEKNIIGVKGAVPGHAGGYVEIVKR